MDLLPTFAELAGASLPKAELDGVSLRSVLHRPDKTFVRTVFYYRGDTLYAVRKGQHKVSERGVD